MQVGEHRTAEPNRLGQRFRGAEGGVRRAAETEDVAAGRIEQQDIGVGVVRLEVAEARKEPPGQVVLVPAGHDERHGGAGREACGQRVGPPVPGGVADRQRVGLGAVFERVVDDE